MPKTRPNTTACPVCARLERAWAGIQQFERPQCLRCFRARHGQPLLVPPVLSETFALRRAQDERRVEGAPDALSELPDPTLLRVSRPLTSRQVDHRYRMLDHLRRQAQMAARRVLAAG